MNRHDTIPRVRGSSCRVKVPRDIVFVDDLPRTALGKVQHFMLRRLDTAEASQERHLKVAVLGGGNGRLQPRRFALQAMTSGCGGVTRPSGCNIARRAPAFSSRTSRAATTCNWCW